MKQAAFHVEQSGTEHLSGCPICGDGSMRTSTSIKDYSVSGEEFQLDDCSSCGFRFTNPRPSQRSIGRYYESPDYISHSNSDRGILARVYQLVRKRTLASKYSALHKHHPHGRVLDIGCGTGEFLSYLMGRGYMVHGIEPNPRAREQAIANHSIEVLPSVDQMPAQEQFQVVTLWHVLEHLPDLHELFKRLYAFLSVGGVLIIAVPDRNSWDAKHYGPFWAALDVPRHFSHFRKKDVVRLLHEHGFDLIQTRPMWFDSTYVSLLSERYKGRGSPVAWFNAVLMGAVSNLVALISGRSTSSTIFIARKAEV